MPSIKQLQSVLLALLFVCVAAAVLWWLWSTVDARGQRLSERIQTIENEQAFEAQYNELITMVEATADERAQLEQYILDGENDTIALLSQLDAIALAHDVGFGTSQLNVKQREGTYDELTVGFNIRGAEENVMRVIELFEVLPYHGTITALNITREFGEAGEQQASAHISLALTIKNYDQ